MMNPSYQTMAPQKRPNVRVLVHGCQNKPQPIQKGSFIDKIINPTEPTKYYTPVFHPVSNYENYLNVLKNNSSEKIYNKYKTLHEKIKCSKYVPYQSPEPIVNPEDEERYLELLSPYLSKFKSVPLKYNVKIFKSLGYSQEKIKSLKKLYASRDAKNLRIWANIIDLFDIEADKNKKSKKSIEKEVEVDEFDLGDTEDECSEEEIDEEPFDVECDYDEEQGDEEEYIDDEIDD